MQQRLGDGKECRFWTGLWAGEKKPVKELFPRLFYLSNKQEGTAREMGRREMEVGAWLEKRYP